MKRKDWISLLFLPLIIVVAYFGHLFFASGNHVEAASEIAIYLLPSILFFILAVILRTRKGNYAKLFKGISYACFTIAAAGIIYMAIPFTHFLNVLNNKEQVKKKVEMILSDHEEMVKTYTNEINSLRQTQGEDIADALMDIWEESYMTGYTTGSDNKLLLDKDKISEYTSVLIDNYALFSAPANLKLLLTEFDTDKTTLTKKYNKCNQDAGKRHTFKYSGKEKEWKNIEELFTEFNVNILYLALYLLLAIIACSSYIFIKDDSVRAPKKKDNNMDDVYSLGHKL